MKNRRVFMDQADDGAQGGASGGGAGGAGAAPGSVLATGATAAGSEQGAAGGAGPNDWIPEKHRVNKADGTLDIEASARKVAEAHRHLEQKLGSGDVPPNTPEEYAPKVEIEGFKWDEFKDDPEMQSFLKAAHAKGVTNEQMSFILGEYMQRAPSLMQGAKQLDDQAASAELRKDWKTDDEFSKNVGLAFKAFDAFAAEADRARIDEISNNPIVLRLLANIGKEMQEDSLVNGGGVPDEGFNSKAAELRAELEKLPLSDPRRKQAKAEIDALYNRRYGSRAQRLGGGASRPTVA